MKYYYIDFGNTRQYNPEDGTLQCLVPYGGDATVPEFKYSKCRNIVTLTLLTFIVLETSYENILQRFVHPFLSCVHLVKINQQGDPMCDFSKYGFDFMKPLLKDMCQDYPTKRTAMEEVVSRFEVITQRLSWWKLRSLEGGRTACSILTLPQALAAATFTSC